MVKRDVSVKGKALKKLLGAARKYELAFAYCPGQSAENDVFIMHRERNAATLSREARSEGEGSKVAFGMASLSSKLLTLKCERDLAGLAKKLKGYLRAEKSPLNVQVLDKNGKPPGRRHRGSGGRGQLGRGA